MIAGLIHANSPRRDGPFVKINCAALTETLLESELFGHEKGSFTGADRRREGRFRQADGGTLFLDEVSEMSLGMQVKLLRVLQERELTRVGGEEVIRVDVRLIAATNRDLQQEIAAGRFREDLYYRLNVIPVFIPPLRERREDILPMIKHFLKIYNQNYNTGKNLSIDALNAMLNYDWPGNVREVRNTIERMVVISTDDVIAHHDLPGEIRKAYRRDGGTLSGVPPVSLPTAGPLKDALAAVERDLLREALKATATLAEAARRLQIDLSTLTRKKRKYGL
jgi:two-component system response regulator HydG